MNRLPSGLSIVVALASCTPAADSAPPPPPAQEIHALAIPQDLFARVNGVTLHYLDWGGKGDLLLFIHGWGHTAHSFDGIAPAFTDRYRVMGLTRRNHGASEKPTPGHDLNTLAQDIVAFMDAVGAKRTILVGHSFAGLEMPLVAARAADRVTGIVFLDAVYDWPGLVSSLGDKGIGRYFQLPDSALASREALEDWYRRRDPTTWGAAQAATLRSQTYLGKDGRMAWQLSAAMSAQLPKLNAKPAAFSGIRAPVLALWAKQAEPAAASMKAFGYSASDIELWRKWAAEVDVPNKQRGIEQLKRAVPNATVVEMRAPHTLHWYNPTEVIRLMNRFLSGLPTTSSRATG
ncbi:MAG: alpha/beta hydrolase [Gemmatimonadota bacterium]